jgi:delta 1-pyrroline-5-carboxylate dehydrogenase
LLTPGQHDGMGVVVQRRNGVGNEIILVRNHEQSTSTNAANKVGALSTAVSKYDTGTTSGNFQIGGTTNLVWRNGEWVGSSQTIPVRNPATGAVLGTVPRLGAEETRRAIDAAERAWPAWRAKTAKERSVILRKWFDLMMANQEDLAVLMTIEQGKPLFESRGEIAYSAAFIEWFGEEGKRAYGDVIPAHGRDKRIVVLKQPIGVTAAITPWNFPAAMIARKVGPALAAGCTMVIKPSELTPYSALAMCVLAERAGVPGCGRCRGVVRWRSAARCGGRAGRAGSRRLPGRTAGRPARTGRGR